VPGAKSKADLIGRIRKQRKALETQITLLSLAELTRPGVLGEWSVKDILAHLVEWEQLFLGWYHAGQGGLVPHTPAAGYKWNQLAALNQAIFERYRANTLEEVLDWFANSFCAMILAVEEMEEAELFAPDCYPWTNQHALADWIEANTSKHYAWARKMIRKGLKSARAAEQGSE
jgi:hypothetical protein